MDTKGISFGQFARAEHKENYSTWFEFQRTAQKVRCQWGELFAGLLILKSCSLVNSRPINQQVCRLVVRANKSLDPKTLFASS